MTAFAAATGEYGPWTWSWDLRSVNGRGLDLRLRLPDWIDGLEAALRARLQKALSRGNVTLGLRVTRTAAGPEGGAMERALDAVMALEALAAARGHGLAPSSAAQVLSVRTDDAAPARDETGELGAALLRQFDEALLPAFLAMRDAEGAATAALLAARIDEVADLTARARNAAADRAEDQRRALRAALDRIAPEVAADPDRLAQELALIAVKSDVTEELERLGAHVEAARNLLAGEGPVGRKLDFLTQEFNREANTLCAKSQSETLTRIGLDLKYAIDQMREQVQNVE
ncbi:YicC/YloC family endoribonuclease [Palleronia sediminis]|nr:YicC/YloC family endoribonuclease [Palleronia sediminis]